jgi:hypothetical protein
MPSPDGREPGALRVRDNDAALWDGAGSRMHAMSLSEGFNQAAQSTAAQDEEDQAGIPEGVGPPSPLLQPLSSVPLLVKLSRNALAHLPSIALYMHVCMCMYLFLIVPSGYYSPLPLPGQRLSILSTRPRKPPPLLHT